MKKELKPLKEYVLKSCKQGNYINVLDKDSVLAARSLVKKDVEKSYKLLVETYEEIRNDKIYHEPLAETLLYSRENFTWFYSFLKELENILGVTEKDRYEAPFEKCPISIRKAVPVIYQPFHAVIIKKVSKLLGYKVLSKNLHPINNYRLKYVMENYDLSDFVEDSYPAWYLLKETTVFEQYSEKTNTRVRVDFRDGEFHYFIAGASDNWQKIEGVPIEMDHVVAALLFRSFAEY